LHNGSVGVEIITASDRQIKFVRNRGEVGLVHRTKTLPRTASARKCLLALGAHPEAKGGVAKQWYGRVRPSRPYSDRAYSVSRLHPVGCCPPNILALPHKVVQAMAHCSDGLGATHSVDSHETGFCKVDKSPNQPIGPGPTFRPRSIKQMIKGCAGLLIEAPQDKFAC